MVRRQTDAEVTETRVYKYGLVPIGTVPEEAISELWRANQLWNNLVALHRDHREKYDEARCKAHPAYGEVKERWDEADALVDQAFDAKRTARMQAGTRDTSHPLVRDAVDEITRLKKRRGDIYAELKPIRAKADKLVDRQTLNSTFNDAVNAATRTENSGLYSATADEVSKNFRNARERSFRTGGILRRHRFDGTGFFAFRFRRKDAKVDGVYFQELFQGNKETAQRFIFTGRDDTRKKPRLRLRATLAGGRKATERVIQQFDVIYHRPVPEGAQINNGKIIRARTGDRFTWHLVLTVKTIRRNTIEIDESHAVGIDLGFRATGESVQVATIYHGSPNIRPEAILAPVEMVKALKRVEDLKSALDDAATELGKAITPLLKQQPLDEDHPKFRLWKSAARLPSNVTLSSETAYKLSRWLLWDPNALPEEAAVEIMKWWKTYSRRYREHHNLRAKQLRNRKHFYRQVASDLVALKRLIVLEDINLTRFAEARDRDTNLNNTARAQRFTVSPSEFRNAVINAATREGVPVVKVPPQFTSKTCHECGTLNRELKAEKEWTCPNCGVIHDRDENAARNIAAKGKSWFEDQKNNPE